MWARQHLFEPVFQDAKAEREHVAAIQEDFLKRSFNALLAQADEAIIAAEEEIDRGVQGAEGGSARPRSSRSSTSSAAGSAWRRPSEVATSSAATSPSSAAHCCSRCPALLKLGSERAARRAGRYATHEIEQIAVRVARQYETGRGADGPIGRGGPRRASTCCRLRGLERRCIEVKGRAGVARVELTWSEFAKSQELGDDYWLYVVLDCGQPVPSAVPGAEPSPDPRRLLAALSRRPLPRRPRARHRSLPEDAPA